MIWWGREATAGDPVLIGDDGTPRLFAGDHRTVSAAVIARIAAFTPTWTRRDDAGRVLVTLFGEQVETVAARLGRWPEKALVELLITAGVSQRPPTPATAMVTFTVSDAAVQSVLVPAGFQIGARPAGRGELVTFETDRDLIATPATIAALAGEVAGVFAPLASPPFVALDDVGSALWIGLASSVSLEPRLTFGVTLETAGPPAPASEGGVLALPIPPRPLVRWHVLDEATLLPAEVVFDDTDSFARSGLIELVAPRVWRAGVPSGSGAPPLRWVRASVASGRFAPPPIVAAIALNATTASAAVTVTDEVLEPLDPEGRTFQLARAPIVQRSLVLAVDEGEALDGELSSADERVWREVDQLAQFGPDDRVFAVDPALGLVFTGDGVHGHAVPAGFRNVIARRYRSGGGAAGAVDAAAITTLVGGAPFITQVTNPSPASGGDDVEPFAAAVARGPQEIRARGRAVTLADYELAALATPFVSVRRAHAMQGHPSYLDAALTGVVGVMVVPAPRAGGPPIANSDLLRAVAHHLASEAAPAGVEVVAAPVAFHTVQVQTRVLLDPAAPVGSTIEAVLATLDRYFDPLVGGDDGTGWPFGGAIVYTAVLRQLVGVSGVRAVSRLDLVVDGDLADECADVLLPAHALIWPGAHAVVPEDA